MQLEVGGEFLLSTNAPIEEVASEVKEHKIATIDKALRIKALAEGNTDIVLNVQRFSPGSTRFRSASGF